MPPKNAVLRPAREMRELAQLRAAQKTGMELRRVTEIIQKAADGGKCSCTVPGALRPEAHEALRAMGYEVGNPRSVGYNETEVEVTW